MRDILSVDLFGIMEAELEAGERPPDGMLHPSTHLAAPLRHAQLDMAGAPKKPRPLIDRIVLHTGTMWHRQIGEWLTKNGVSVLQEIDVTPWLPAGWSGRPDLVFWNAEYKAFVLVDLKTTKGESLKYRHLNGASEEHVLQTSVYWHALKKMGLPLMEAIGVAYIPKNDTRSADVIEPVLIDFDPLPEQELQAMMDERRDDVVRYVKSVRPVAGQNPHYFLTDELAPETPMEQRVYFDKATGDYVLKLIPNWTAMFCPYDAELCPCSEQKSYTIGRYDDAGTYRARKGFEEIEPTVAPS